ncbi:sulfite exporter TauE/SafE family protein [Aquibacillus rhizosphaerae]|uniref:Probable membrane transporter protein n=1 Tax=Aquibacillus rhizosphaerae TaxID=3051431 RepID=A0ABT7L261_9BACI|nr:sulfite exporter TauE/SafE family protein [Aquibacillus sp. LR5S19]MDL4839940.1 sulfite exporter TauE/SafE family protein [Aquibacillus sp. LR5S19]
MFLITSIIIGFLAAFVGSIAGLGGGVILVPTLLVLHELFDSFNWATSQNVVSISLIVMIFTALSSSISYYKENRIDYKSGFIFVLASIPGGVLGSYLNKFINTEQFSLYFGFLMLAMFAVFFLKKRNPSQENHTGIWVAERSVKINNELHRYSYSKIIAVVVAFFVGVLSGLFGIGGGSLMVPAMILLFRFPAHIATATSMFMIVFLSISSSLSHIFLGHVNWEYVWMFIPGAWFGGIVGAKVNQRMKSSTVELFLRVLLIIIGIRLIWQGIG